MLKNLKGLRDALRDRLGVVRKTARPVLHPKNQFERDCIATESYHRRRLGIDRRIESNADSLK
jgi:hypothetical protein